MLIAHGGHWLVNVSYAVPVVGLLLWIGLVKLRERRDDGGREREQPD